MVEETAVGQSAASRIGRSQFTPAEFEDAVLQRYQLYYDQAHADVMDLVNRGVIKNDRTVIGSEIDRFARDNLRQWLATEGISEGPGEIIAVNRRLYDPLDSGRYRQPDVYIPGSRLILDGTIAEKTGTMPQIIGFRNYSGGANVMIIRPLEEGGSYRIRFP